MCYKNGRVQLVDYAKADFNLAGLDESSYDGKLKVYLKVLLNKMKPKSSWAYVSMPNYSGLLSLVEFPAMSEKELEKAIVYEAHNYIPAPMEEVSLSWEIIAKPKEVKLDAPAGVPSTPPKDEKIQVVLVAALKEKVMRMATLLELTKVKLKSVELETFSLARALVGDDKGIYLILDIGYQTSSIILVDKGVIKISRSLDVGGVNITNTIVENFNISKERAETLKKQANNYLEHQDGGIVFPVLDSIIGEIKRVTQSFPASKIDCLILSGGSARMSKIGEYITKATGIQTALGDPWKKILADKKVQPLLAEAAPLFSVAVGLALRGADDYNRS